MVLSACLPESSPTQQFLPGFDEPTDQLGLGTIVLLGITLPEPDAASPRAAETLALVGTLLEAGFGDMAEVVPQVGETPPSPGLSVPNGADVDAWSATVSLAPSKATPGSLRLGIELCEVVDRCEVLEATATPALLPQALGPLLESASVVLGRRAPDVTRAAWTQPVSNDPYAITVLGRAAASWYGFAAPTAAEKWGDKRADPMTRAGFLDPAMPYGFWLAGRRALGAELDARVPLQRAAMARPGSASVLAAEAQALLKAGKPRDALARYELIDQLLPGDPRFVRDHARTALDLGEVELAQRVLARAPLGLRETRDLLVLRVRASDDGKRDLDELLALWQQRVPDDPEPVRRRIERRVRDDRFADALALVPVLRERGEDPSALAGALQAAVDHDAAPTDRAPAVQDLRAGLASAEASMQGLGDRANEVGALQNTLAADAGVTLGELCTGPKAETAQRSDAGGRAWRDAVLEAQRAVRQARTLADSETVAPLVSDAEAKELADLEARILGRAREFAVGRAWHRTYVASRLLRCPAKTAGG